MLQNISPKPTGGYLDLSLFLACLSCFWWCEKIFKLKRQLLIATKTHTFSWVLTWKSSFPVESQVPFWPQGIRCSLNRGMSNPGTQSFMAAYGNLLAAVNSLYWFGKAWLWNTFAILGSFLITEKTLIMHCFLWLLQEKLCLEFSH